MENLSFELGPPIDPDRIELELPVALVRQPLGDLFLASISHVDLTRLTYFDVRRVIQEQRDIEKYLGIQRPVSKSRIAELTKFVRFKDSSFPTSIIVAIEPGYARYNDQTRSLVISNFLEGELKPSIAIKRIGRVIDGQHRIEGLMSLSKDDVFDMPVVFLLEADISDQAYMFAMVNLEQTKVNKSLALDLFSLAQTNSPERAAHRVVVALDSDKSGPFFQRIKRLGVATPGRSSETLSQANFVATLLPYLTDDRRVDRDLVLRGKPPSPAVGKEKDRLIFRNFWIEGKDEIIAGIIDSYFLAVSQRWPKAWNSLDAGNILPRTNGFRALMKVLKPIYLEARKNGSVPSTSDFRVILERIQLTDTDFTTDKYLPGSSGESALRKDLEAFL
jgi:DGQHR domain-containing protein